MWYRRQVRLVLYAGAAAQFIGLQGAYAVEVTVVTAKGLAIEGAEVALVDSASRTDEVGTSDKNGKVVLKDTKAASALVLCAHPGFGGFVKKLSKPEEQLRIVLKQDPGIGSALFLSQRWEVPTLKGQLTVILDQQNQLHVYSPNLTLNDGREQLLVTRYRRPIRIADSNGAICDIRILAVEGKRCLTDYKSTKEAVKVADDSVLVTDVAGDPISGAQVYLIHPQRKTHFDGETNADGIVSFEDGHGEIATVFCAHPNYRASILDEYVVGEPLHVQLVAANGIGSLVCDGTGHIPGLDGRLNPILDNIGRYYIYADNIAVDGGKTQPVPFKLGRPVSLVDAQANQFQVVILHFIGRTSVLEFVSN